MEPETLMEHDASGVESSVRRASEGLDVMEVSVPVWHWQ